MLRPFYGMIVLIRKWFILLLPEENTVSSPGLPDAKNRKYFLGKF
jgi:hypothetical protein